MTGQTQELHLDIDFHPVVGLSRRHTDVGAEEGRGFGPSLDYVGDGFGQLAEGQRSQLDDRKGTGHHTCPRGCPQLAIQI